jgi:ABC-type nitrate/sulfonate/bicarbonate transport system substrate-binding protein
MMKRRTFVAASAGLVAGLGAGRTASALTSLPIGTSRDPNNGALLIVAKGKNYFRDNGLDVSLKYFPSAGDLVSAMASGALNIGSGGSVPTTTLRASGFPAVVLAQQADISNAQEVVAEKSISAPKDFEGKKVGANFGTVSEMLAETMLRRYGVPSDKVTLVNLGPADMVTALLRGDIAGAALWEPWCSQAVKGGAHRLVSGSESYIPGQSGPVALLGDHGLLVASKPWVDANGPTVTAVLKSLIAAQEFIAKQPDAAAQIVGTELNVPAQEMKGLMARNRYSMAIDAKLIRDMNAEAAFLRGLGKLKNPVQASDWVYTGPLAKVDAKLVNWRA